MVDWTLENTPMDEAAERRAEEEFAKTGIRTWLLSTYAIGAYHYENGFTPPHSRKSLSAVRAVREVGCLLWYGLTETHRGRKCIMINVDDLVAKWHKLVVGLATAHDKDEADRYEASVEECLNPLLRAPVKQLREFAGKLRDSLKNDPTVPYLVWRALETWVDKVVLLAPDEDVKVLKTQLAEEIVNMVEDDAKRDLPAAMVRALQWRSPAQLEKVKTVIEKEQAAGRTTRLRGRESCLFLEAGGTEDEPKICIQV